MNTHQLPQNQVKQMLESGQRVSVLSIYNSLRTFEGRKIISNLRATGMKIADEWKRNDGGKKFKVYFKAV